MTFEYKVVPAPARGVKAKGLKTPEDRFAYALETAMNDLAREGWEYVRADTLPCEQRDGLMSKTTAFQNLLVFRREKATPVAMITSRQEPEFAPPPVAAPTLQEDAAGPDTVDDYNDATEIGDPDETPQDKPASRITAD